MKADILYTHKDLVEKSKLGDRKSQYQLYELYVDAMYNVSMRMVKTKEDAEDIVQDSFVEVFKNLSSFRYESTFGSWLKRIVINKSINHLKLKKIAVVPLENEIYKIGDDVDYNPPEVNIKKVIKSISLLPSGFQQIINLYLIEGYDHVEIGEILGIATSTSKSQYHRGKKKLIEMINEL
ncbi:RNA polymerase sigma factor [Pontimicrobium sp. SW4]|uniref:RNA polymerase sigma factor n=1 Tax=Pontimicrobium sp. SW4 TaxID=3153519 RepID=A0AAU7BWN2_9FLAO